jgi:hypothetical protein
VRTSPHPHVRSGCRHQRRQSIQAGRASGRRHNTQLCASVADDRCQCVHGPQRPPAGSRRGPQCLTREDSKAEAAVVDHRPAVLQRLQAADAATSGSCCQAWQHEDVGPYARGAHASDGGGDGGAARLGAMHDITVPIYSTALHGSTLQYSCPTATDGFVGTWHAPCSAVWLQSCAQPACQRVEARHLPNCHVCHHVQASRRFWAEYGQAKLIRVMRVAGVPIAAVLLPPPWCCR